MRQGDISAVVRDIQGSSASLRCALPARSEDANLVRRPYRTGLKAAMQRWFEDHPQARVKNADLVRRFKHLGANPSSVRNATTRLRGEGVIKSTYECTRKGNKLVCTRAVYQFDEDPR